MKNFLLPRAPSLALASEFPILHLAFSSRDFHIPRTLSPAAHIRREPCRIRPQGAILRATVRTRRLHVIGKGRGLEEGDAFAVDPGPEDAAAKGPTVGAVAGVAAVEGVAERDGVEEVGGGGRGGEVVGARVEGSGCAGASGGGRGGGSVDIGVLRKGKEGDV